MLTDEHTQKLANLNYLLTISQKPRDTGNPLNDMTGISGGKPLPKGTPAPKEMQLPLPGIDWEKFKVQSTPNNRSMSIAQGVDMNPIIEQEAPEGTIFTTPIIDGPSPDKGIGPENFPKPGFIEQQLAQISPTDTPRDLRIQDAVKKYGKNPKTGEYINPTLLIKHLLRA